MHPALAIPARTAARASTVALGLALLTMLSGCDQLASSLRAAANQLDAKGSASTGSSQLPLSQGGTLPVPEVQKRNDTPDMALRSHFANVHRHKVRAYNFRITAELQRDVLEAREAAQLYTGPALEYFEVGSALRRPPNMPYLYPQKEEIVKLENQSETRVIATVRIKLGAPPPPASSRIAIESAQKLMSAGEEFIYTLTKTDTGWAIESVQEMRYPDEYDPNKTFDKVWRTTMELDATQDSTRGAFPRVYSMFGVLN